MGLHVLHIASVIAYLLSIVINRNFSLYILFVYKKIQDVTESVTLFATSADKKSESVILDCCTF